MKFFQKSVETDIHEPTTTTPNNFSESLLNIKQNTVKTISSPKKHNIFLNTIATDSSIDCGDNVIVSVAYLREWFSG